MEERAKFWSESRGPKTSGEDMTASLAYPPLPFEAPFVGRDVLEIGPGRGRQYMKLKGVAKSYAVADISCAILDDPTFSSCTRYHIVCSDYSDNLWAVFDIVHFWYVLHHVKVAELSSFFGFVYRSLREDGLVLFNTPQLQNPKECYPGDGLGTTWITPEMVAVACDRLFDFWIVGVDAKSTGYVMAGRKL